MATVEFKYSDFLYYYDYRVNTTNLLFDPSASLTTIYYYDEVYQPSHSFILRQKVLPDYYILIDNKPLYISILPPKKSGNDRILFSIPTEINGNLWDIHYHFGVDYKFNKTKSIKNGKRHGVIFFHKTIQDPNSSSNYKDKCYFLEDDTINDVSAITCVEDGNTIMTQNFPMESEDFIIIEEIIKRPFFGVQRGGRRGIYIKKRKNKTRRRIRCNITRRRKSSKKRYIRS